MKRLTTGTLALCAIGFAVAAMPARAADLPCGTAKLIVPWGAGGGTDVIFRIVAQSINKAGAKPSLQVVNVPGQGGNKGAKEAQKARPDGCTLFAVHQSAITSYFTGRVDFTWAGFEPVALLTRTPPIIGAHPSVPFKNLTDLIAAAKEEPGNILTGATLGSTSHFWFLLLEDAAGIKLKYIPYDGTRQRMTALLASNIQLGEINLAAAKKYIQTDELKALAIYTEERNEEIPNMPTAKEQGIDLVAGTDRGVLAPEGTPEEATAFWADAFEKAMKDPAVVKQMNAKGSLVVFKRGDDYEKYMETTYDKWESVAKKVGVYKRKE